jgi:hypothetical protein
MSTADFSPEYEPPFRGPVAQRGNGMAVASLVCGVLFCFFITAPLAVIFGIVGLLKTRDPYVGGKGMSIAGIILGIVGIGFWVLFGAAIFAAFMAVGAAGSSEAKQFTELVAQDKIDDAMEMTMKPVTREDVEKLADDLKTWGKPGVFTAKPGFTTNVDQATQLVSMTYKGTAKFENATKNYEFVLTGKGGVQPPQKKPVDPKAPMTNVGFKISAFKFEWRRRRFL